MFAVIFRPRSGAVPSISTNTFHVCVDCRNVPKGCLAPLRGKLSIIHLSDSTRAPDLCRSSQPGVQATHCQRPVGIGCGTNSSLVSRTLGLLTEPLFLEHALP